MNYKKIKTIFFHDHITTVKNNKLYSSGGLNNKVFLRYHRISNKLSLATREDKKRDVTKLTFIDNFDNLKFTAIPNLASLRISNHINSFRVISSLIEKNDFIIIRLPSLIGLVAAFFSSQKGKNYMIEIVGCPLDAYWYYSLKGKIISYPIYYLTKYFIKNAENVLYVTNSFLQKKYPTNALNKIDCSDVELSSKRKKIVKNHKNRENIKIRTGMIGSLNSKYKGFDLAIKAISEIKFKHKKNVYLEIVGNGNSSKIKKLSQKYNVEKQIIIKGSLSHPTEIFNWLDSIDLYIHPSRVEALPRSLLEAMSRGCACVASSVGDIPELIHSKYRHPKNDFKKLASLIYEHHKTEVLNDNIKRCLSKIKEYTKVKLDNKRNLFLEKCLLKNQL
jgi:glycosyltransferase involved in cell wall biosynthesis